MSAYGRTIAWLLTALFVAFPAAAFDSTDLEGEWLGSGMIATSTGNDPTIWDLDLEIDEDGMVTGTGTRYGTTAEGNEEEISETVSGGPLTISAQGGVINGSILLDNDDITGINFDGYRMNPAKDLISGSDGLEVETNSSFLTFVKKGINFVQTDLEGLWFVTGYYETLGAESHDPGVLYGLLEIDSNGALVVDDESKVGFLYYLNQGFVPFADGTSFSLNQSGFVDADPTFGGDEYLFLSTGKTLMIGNSLGYVLGGDNEQRLFQAVKLEACPASALAGRWELRQFDDALAEIDPGTTLGEITINDEGTALTGGSLAESNGSVWTVTGGLIEGPEQYGCFFEITGVGLQDNGSKETSYAFGLSPDRDVLFGISLRDDDYSSLVVGIQLPEPDAPLLALAGLMSLLALRWRQRESNPTRKTPTPRN